MGTNKILVLDIGGTNTAAAVLNSTMSLNELQQVTPYKIRTIGRMNKTLPKIILDFNHFDDYDKIIINVPFEVDKEKNVLDPDDFYVKNREVPLNFPELVSQIINKPVFIENDAVAWMKGNLKYQKLLGNDIEFPAITLCLGTGIGMAIAKSQSDIKEYNISKKFKGKHFPKLTKTAGYYFKDLTAGKVHKILGKGFLTWVERKRESWTNERISEEYTKRFIALLNDLEHNSPFNFSGFRSIFLCGGNSIYLNQQMIDSYSMNVYYHSSNSVSMNTDIIPLIGSIHIK